MNYNLYNFIYTETAYQKFCKIFQKIKTITKLAKDQKGFKDF